MGRSFGCTISPKTICRNHFCLTDNLKNNYHHIPWKPKQKKRQWNELIDNCLTSRADYFTPFVTSSEPSIIKIILSFVKKFILIAKKKPEIKMKWSCIKPEFNRLALSQVIQQLRFLSRQRLPRIGWSRNYPSYLP